MKLVPSRQVVAVVVTEAAEDVDVRAAAEAVAAVVVVAAGAVSAGSIVFFHRYFCQPAPAERVIYATGWAAQCPLTEEIAWPK